MAAKKEAKAKEANTANIGFEDKIWEAACILRGNLDASEYKHVVLGLIFLKYVSDRFEARRAEILADPELGEDFADDRDEYEAEHVFWVPEVARWQSVASAARTPEIGATIDAAMREIERENDALKGVLPKNFARPELDKRRLGDVVDLFTNVQVGGAGESKDLLGRVYEYCLAKFAEQEGKRAGEFYTPSSVVRALVEILRPFGGRVYDPCCGSGGMFVQSSQFVEAHGGKLNDISVYGQESNPTTWKMARMNLAIRGIEADLGAANADTFYDDLHSRLKADFAMANPPFNLSNWGAEALKDDVRWTYGLPPTGNANFAWLQHIASHLNPSGGRAGVVLANGSLSSQTGGEDEIRRKMVEADLVECVVWLPDKLFYSTTISASLWFLARKKKRPGTTLFIDARNMGTMVTRNSKQLTDAEITKLGETYEAYAAGTLEDVKGYVATVETAQIAAQDYILTPGRYVGVEEREADAEPFEDKMARLTAELSELFAKSRELETTIKKNLGALGYEI